MELRGSLFRFFGNLVFVQHYNGFACFLRSRGIPKRSKIDEKTYLENVIEKNFEFTKICQKAPQNGSPKVDYSTRGPTIGLSFRAFFPSLCQRVPKRVPRACQSTQSTSPKRPKRLSRASRSTQSTTQWYQNRDRRLLQASQNVVDSCSALIQK